MPTDIKQLQRVQDLTEGALITNASDGTGYLFHNGVLTAVANPSEVLAAGIRPEKAAVFSADPAQIEELLTRRTRDQAQQTQYIKLVNTMLTGTKTFDSGDVFLGSGHYMRTSGALNLADGAIAAQTRTRTVTWFGGYAGAARVIFADGNDVPIHQSQDHRYPVDGTWVGQSDRTDAWYETMKATRVGDVHRIYVFQSWAPDSFNPILDKWAKASGQVAQLAADVAAVAKVVALVV